MKYYYIQVICCMTKLQVQESTIHTILYHAAMYAHDTTSTYYILLLLQVLPYVHVGI